MMEVLKEISRSVPRLGAEPKALFESAMDYFYHNRNETLFALAEGLYREAENHPESHIHLDRVLGKIRVQLSPTVEYLIWDGTLEDTIPAGTIRFLDYMTAGGVVGIYMTLASLVALMVLSEAYPEAKVYIHLKPSAVKVYR